MTLGAVAGALAMLVGDGALEGRVAVVVGVELAGVTSVGAAPLAMRPGACAAGVVTGVVIAVAVAGFGTMAGTSNRGAGGVCWTAS